MRTRRATDDGVTTWVGVVLVCGTLLATALTGVAAVRAIDDADDADDPADLVAADVSATSGPSDRSGQAPSSTSMPTTTTTPPTTTTTSMPTTTTTPPTTTAPTTTTTTTPPPTTTTTTTAPPAPPSLRQGSVGDDVAALQHRLAELGFFVPVVDGRYGSITAQAVMAFQKSAGIGRDGIAGPTTLAALETASPIAPLEGGDHIEIDLDRQLMIVVRGDTTLAFNTSTGTEGWRTPPGRFRITRQIDGVRHAPLGDLYRPKYFNGGIALHGSASIPGHPASHGCARLHDDVVDLIWARDLAPIGTPVWVH